MKQKATTGIYFQMFHEVIENYILVSTAVFLFFYTKSNICVMFMRDTPLHRAAEYIPLVRAEQSGKSKCVKVLIEAGASIEAKNNDG